MTSSSLDNLVRVGQLKTEPPTQAEFDGLVRSGRVRLADAGNPALALESRFDLAYNAAHALSLAALRWHGYRSENRYQVFQTLTHTLALDATQWRILDQAHRKRNLAEYEGDLDVDEALVAAIIRVVQAVAERVAALGRYCVGMISVCYVRHKRLLSMSRQMRMEYDGPGPTLPSRIGRGSSGRVSSALRVLDALRVPRTGRLCAPARGVICGEWGIS